MKLFKTNCLAQRKNNVATLKYKQNIETKYNIYKYKYISKSLINLLITIRK